MIYEIPPQSHPRNIGESIYFRDHLEHNRADLRALIADVLAHTKTNDSATIVEEQKALGRDVPQEYIPLIEKIEFCAQSAMPANFLADSAEFTITDRGQTITAHRSPNSTPIADVLSTEIPGKEFIEFGCSNPSNPSLASVAPLIIAKELGASRYIGVEPFRMEDVLGREKPVYDNQGKYTLAHSPGNIRIVEQENFSQMWNQDDMLGFTSKIQKKAPRVLLLSGLEWPIPTVAEQKNIDAYFEALWKEFDRICTENSIVIVGKVCNNETCSAATVMANTGGFTRIASDQFFDIYRKNAVSAP